MSQLNPGPSTTSRAARDWRREAREHASRVDALIGPWLAARNEGESQPVLDFLFEYYRFRPGRLSRYSPGIGVLLEGGARRFGELRGFATEGADAWVDPGRVPEKRRRSFRWILGLLEATASRPAQHACHGLHEWAMVYRSDAPRHAQLPMRLEAEGIAEVVEGLPMVCSHYDAFRFFTPEARPLNRHQLEADDALELEQPGCIHANMDLYRWAFKGFPWIGSARTLEAFELAVRARIVDMQASPYDLSARGFEPIRIETPEGRAEYRARQRGIAEAAAPIRARLIEDYRALVASW